MTSQLQNLVWACWDQDPTKWPSFANIVPLTQIICETTPLLTEDFTPSYISELPELEIKDPVSSPDIRPVLLPIRSLMSLVLLTLINSHTRKHQSLLPKLSSLNQSSFPAQTMGYPLRLSHLP